MSRKTHRVSDFFLGLRFDPKSKITKLDKILFYVIRVSHYTLAFRENLRENYIRALSVCVSVCVCVCVY